MTVRDAGRSVVSCKPTLKSVDVVPLQAGLRALGNVSVAKTRLAKPAAAEHLSTVLW
jgi:hypothetical protein